MKMFNKFNKMKFIMSIFCFLCAANFNGHFAQAADEPVTMDSRIKTYIYNPNEVFPVILHYGYHNHIDFPKNEFIKNIIVGNRADWEITNSGNRIFLQTYSRQAHTNMTVITNKRTYEFDLVAKGELHETDYDLAYAIKFYYPEEAKVVDTKFNQEENGETGEISDLVQGKINANYVYRGDTEVTPLVAFNDEKFTYLKFREGVVPKVETFTKNGKKQEVKIFSYNGYIIVNNIFPRIKLSYNRKSAYIYNKGL
jgi:type IV secretion system protein VirB9